MSQNLEGQEEKKDLQSQTDISLLVEIFTVINTMWIWWWSVRILPNWGITIRRHFSRLKKIQDLSFGQKRRSQRE